MFERKNCPEVKFIRRAIAVTCNPFFPPAISIMFPMIVKYNSSFFTILDIEQSIALGTVS